MRPRLQVLQLPLSLILFGRGSPFALKGIVSRKALLFLFLFFLSPLSWGQNQCHKLFGSPAGTDLRTNPLPQSVGSLLKTPQLRGILETPEMKELMARLKVDDLNRLDERLLDPSVQSLARDLVGNLRELHWILEGLKSAFRERPWLGRRKQYEEARRFLISLFSSRRLQVKEMGSELGLVDFEPDTFKILTGLSSRGTRTTLKETTLEKAMENARLRKRQEEILRQCRASKKGGALGHMFRVSAGTGVAVTGAVHALHFLGTGELRVAEMSTSMIMTVLGTGVGLKLVGNPDLKVSVKYQRLILMNAALLPIDATIYSLLNGSVPEAEKRNRVEDRMAYNFAYSLASNLPGIFLTSFFQNSWCLAKEGLLGNIRPGHVDLMTSANRLVWGQLYAFGESRVVTGHSVDDVTQRLDTWLGAFGTVPKP